MIALYILVTLVAWCASFAMGYFVLGPIFWRWLESK